MNRPPEDWNDVTGWNGYFHAELTAGRASSDPEFIVLRFLSLAHEKGGAIWFPGCGLDPYALTYAARGCRVLATDISPVAVLYQRKAAADFLNKAKLAQFPGTLTIANHDFTTGPPEGKFDVVINCRAFQGLPSSAMLVAAKHFYAALRPGGVCILDTINVQGGSRRNLIEDSLIAAGFYIPFQKSERWYRAQLDNTGVEYVMILERPHIAARNQYPTERFEEFAMRDQQILDSFCAEYESRCQDEAAEVDGAANDPTTKVAQVVYATG